MTQRIGLTVGLEGGSLPEALTLAEHALASGFTDLWSAEVGGADGFGPLAAIARGSGSARLGTAIVSVFTRPPALLAMSAATLQNLTGGRFVLGLGTSSDIIVEDWMGGRFARPVSRLEEYVEVLRELLAGEKVSHDGRSFGLKGFRLQLDPSAPVPIYLAALGPRACRLAGAVADGVIFFLKSPDGVRQGLKWVAEGAREAGRDPADLDCVMRISVALDEPPETLGLLKRMTTTYAIVDVYNRSLADQGFARETEAILSAWSTGDRKGAVTAVSDAMVDALNIVGDADACRTKLQSFRDAGVKTPVILPLSSTPDPTERNSRISAAIDLLAK